jgi:hypothetical protein
MAYTTIDDGSAFFQTALYTGNGTAIGSGGLTITNDGNSNLQPDWIWHKKRGNAESHAVADTNRGTHKGIFPNENNTESSGGNQYVNSFNTDGFTVGNVGWANDSSQTYVAWQWKANGGTTTSGGSDDTVSTSAHQANTTAGFSIVTYSGTGTQGHTVAHGLGVAPEVIFLKARNKSQNWRVFHHKTASDGTKRLILDQTNAQEDAAFLNDTAPSSTVFTLGASDDAWNASDGTYVAYCFAPIKGYSKFGSYTGNGNADGAFIYTGFKPAWIMLKRTDSTNNWNIFDSKRDVDNQVGNVLYANLNNAEEADASHSSANDFLSNGFKLRETGNAVNGSGASYIYMAFAEHPFVSSKGVPVTAR